MEAEELYKKGMELTEKAERLEEAGRKDPAVNCQTAYQEAAVMRKQAARFWRQAAALDHLEAQYQLACYIHEYEQNKRQQAFELFQTAAERGHPFAQYRLAGYVFTPPEFTTRKRTFWYTKAFENGVLAAGQILAQNYREHRKYQKAIEWNTKIIAFPDVPIYAQATAEYNLGEMQQNHFQDMEQALYWYQFSAEHGDSLAPYRLGEYYESQGDMEQAIPWYRMAAERDFPDAKLWLEQHGL